MDEQRIREIVQEELIALTEQLSLKVVEQSVNAISYGLRRAIAFREEATDDEGIHRS